MSSAPVPSSERAVRLVIVCCAVAAAALLGGIVWAAWASSLFTGLTYLVSDRWGVVTLIDVYAGAVVVAIWMWGCERNHWVWLLWVLALICLGHLVSLAYVLMRAARCRTLLDLLTPTRLAATAANGHHQRACRTN